MTYWDTSALICAFEDPVVAERTNESGQVTRLHTLAEMFSTLTGGRLGFKFQPSVATLMIENMTSTFRFIDLDEQEIKKALHQAEARGVTGGRVHDGLHAVAAKKSGATELLTLNVGDFSGLEDGFQLARP